MRSSSEALLALGRWLLARDYRFTTVTPLTHGRVAARRREATSLRDVFGWSLPFGPGVLPDEALGMLRTAGALTEAPSGLLRSAVRFSSVEDLLVVHSAWPTAAADAVFFGPDTYRYVRMLKGLDRRFGRAVDIGAGSGAGLLSIASRCDEVQLTDINPRALELAEVNAALAGVKVTLSCGDLLEPLDGTFDLIASNPPFLVDDAARAYRHGGERGIALSVRIAEAALGRLAPGGVLALYTCTPVVDGRALLQEALAPRLSRFEGSFEWDEVDVDVYGEELERAAYADVERLSIVGLLAHRPLDDHLRGRDEHVS